MKRRILAILLVVCMLLSVSASLSACGGETPDTPQKLSAPVVTLNDNVASWSADSNADKFEISLDGSLSYVENTVTSKLLTDGQTLKVRAVGNGTTNSTSDWSNSVTYTKAEPQPEGTKLSTPVVSISSTGLASWSVVPNASSYVYKIDNGTETATTVTAVQLTNGQSIVVKAVGDGTNYLDSDYSASATYTQGQEPPSPTKLSAPVVSISNTGLASWGAIANASSYVYKINGGTETATTVTAVQLANGQSIVVKAVGDGTNYLDSDYSAQKTYTEGAIVPTEEPTYLGIIASNNEPSVSNGIPSTIVPRPSKMSLRMMSQRSNRSFNEALDEYFENNSNHLNGSYPQESSYDVYARAGETVYVQIWLNNPSQYTILSLKLNGVKYQVGGHLYSFFIEEGGEHYNCVYVAVTIPNDTYVEKSYVVTEIEYISNTFINADGTDQFMNDNDTVTVGLPYNASNPIVSNFETNTVTTNSCEASFQLSDNGNLAGLSGGWLGVAVYDNYNIIKNQIATAGNNTIEVSDLVEGSYYTIIVYLLADLHDGNGVKAHTLGVISFETLSAVSYFNVESSYYVSGGFEDVEADSGLSIDAYVVLESGTAYFNRLELYIGDELVYTDNNYDGGRKIENLLAETTYRVRVYFSDEQYSEHYVEEYVTTGRMEKPSFDLNDKYPFVNSVAFTFEGFENGFLGVAIAKNLKIKFFNNSVRELEYADYILELCDDPSIVETLQAQYNKAMEDGEWGLANVLYHKLHFYETAKDLMENGDYSENGTDKSAWLSFFDNNILTFESDDEDLFFNNFTTYLIVRGFFDKFPEGECSYKVTADVDFKDGNGFVETTLTEGSLYSVRPINHELNEMSFDFSRDGYKITINPSCRINDERGKKVAIVSYSVGIYTENMELIETLYTSEEIDWQELDEDAWINAYVLAMKGEAIIPSEQAIIEYFDWRAIFEILLNLEIDQENDFTSGDNDIITDGTASGDGVIIDGIISGNGTSSGGTRQKNIANLAERELLRALLEFDYPSTYETTIKAQLLDDFMMDEYYFELISGLETEDEKLEALIDGALNSTIICMIDSYTSHVQHYLTWTGSKTDEIYIGFKETMEAYMEENGYAPEVNWGESYRRLLMFEDFYFFYPFGEFEEITIELDSEKYGIGKYSIGVSYRYDSYEEGRVETHYMNEQIAVQGVLPTPECTISEGRYIGTPNLDIDFWDYYFELEYQDKNLETIYSGKLDNFDTWGNQLQVGQRFRIRAVVNEGVENDIYTGASEWSEWYLFEGIKINEPSLYYSTDDCSVSWDMIYEAEYYLYTINNGEEIRIEADGLRKVYLQNGDVLRVIAVPNAEHISNGYTNSNWAEYTCTDNRQALPTPQNLYVDKSGCLFWDEIDGASSYLMEYTSKGETNTSEVYPGISLISGTTYRIKAIPSNSDQYKPSDWSESLVYTAQLPLPELRSVSSTQIRWRCGARVDGYNYKIGENGQIQTTTNIYIDASLVPFGEKLYVQAYCDGYKDSEWALIYSNVIVLQTPIVNLEAGTASWEAVENADGYLYKINDGDEIATTSLQVSGLVAGDKIVVCATSTQLGYENSEWSEERTQLPILGTPVLNTTLLSKEGTITWESIEGATAYQYEIDGIIEWEYSTMIENLIPYGISVRVRAVCESGEYEFSGAWSELVTREDTRQALKSPVIACDFETGLTVVADDSNVEYYVYRFGTEGYENQFFCDPTGEALVITQDFYFPNEDHTIYVKAVPIDNTLYRESEWSMVTVAFE